MRPDSSATRVASRARLRTLPESPPPFAADARNPAYVDWLENMSMLGDARTRAGVLRGCVRAQQGQRRGDEGNGKQSIHGVLHG